MRVMIDVNVRVAMTSVHLFIVRSGIAYMVSVAMDATACHPRKHKDRLLVHQGVKDEEEAKFAKKLCYNVLRYTFLNAALHF